MINWSNKIPEVCAYGTAADYCQLPDATQRCSGVAPLDSLPAAWWNAMWHDNNAAFNCSRALVNNVGQELCNIIVCRGGTLNANCNSQLYNTIFSVGTANALGMVKSSTTNGQVSIGNDGIMTVNGYGNAALCTTAQTVTGAINELKDAIDNFQGVVYSDAAPLVDGTASAGTSETAARGDHVHPIGCCIASTCACIQACYVPASDAGCNILTACGTGGYNILSACGVRGCNILCACGTNTEGGNYIKATGCYGYNTLCTDGVYGQNVACSIGNYGHNRMIATGGHGNNSIEVTGDSGFNCMAATGCCSYNLIGSTGCCGYNRLIATGCYGYNQLCAGGRFGYNQLCTCGCNGYNQLCASGRYGYNQLCAGGCNGFNQLRVDGDCGHNIMAVEGCCGYNLLYTAGTCGYNCIAAYCCNTFCALDTYIVSCREGTSDSPNTDVARMSIGASSLYDPGMSRYSNSSAVTYMHAASTCCSACVELSAYSECCNATLMLCARTYPSNACTNYICACTNMHRGCYGRPYNGSTVTGAPVTIDLDTYCACYGSSNFSTPPYMCVCKGVLNSILHMTKFGIKYCSNVPGTTNCYQIYYQACTAYYKGCGGNASCLALLSPRFGFLPYAYDSTWRTTGCCIQCPSAPANETCHAFIVYQE